MKTIKIPCSPEVQALNRAVEDADRLTEYQFDTLGLWQLVEAMEFASWDRPLSWLESASQIRLAARP